jgi:hypothetical protein
MDDGELSASEVCLALSRAGNIFSSLSAYQQQQFVQSGFADELLDSAENVLEEVQTTEHVSQLWDALARLPFLKPSSSFLAQLASQTTALVMHFDARQLPLLLWACASMGFNPGDALLTQLAAEVVVRVASFTTQGISLAVWAFATLKFKPQDSELEAVARAMRQRLSQFPPQEVATCLSAFDSLGFTPPTELLQAIADRVGVNLEQIQAMCATGRAANAPATSMAVAATTSRAATTAAANIVALNGAAKPTVNDRMKQTVSQQVARGVAAGAKSVAVGVAAGLKTRQALLTHKAKLDDTVKGVKGRDGSGPSGSSAT